MRLLPLYGAVPPPAVKIFARHIARILQLKIKFLQMNYIPNKILITIFMSTRGGTNRRIIYLRAERGGSIPVCERGPFSPKTSKSNSSQLYFRYSRYFNHAVMPTCRM